MKKTIKVVSLWDGKESDYTVEVVEEPRKQISKDKLTEYLDWLEDSSVYNMEEATNDATYYTRKECARVAKMLKEMIQEGKFDGQD